MIFEVLAFCILLMLAVLLNRKLQILRHHVNKVSDTADDIHRLLQEWYDDAASVRDIKNMGVLRKVFDGIRSDKKDN